MKKLYGFASLIACLLSLAACRSHTTKHTTKVVTQFDIPHISSSLAYRPEWETTPLNENEFQELNAILYQEFNYLGRGAQCWVFASADDKHVIKFFKHYRMRTKDGKERLERTFRSYKIAYEVLRPETGIVFVHLNKTESLHKTVTLVHDKLGRLFNIDLDDMEFLIQKKGARVYPTITQLMEEGEVARAKQLLSNIIKLVMTCSDKGIKARDPFLRTNCGFFGDQAVYIDVGSFAPDENLKTYEGRKKEVAWVMSKDMSWLKENYPELADYVTKEIEKL
jgi:hypothetical protein